MKINYKEKQLLSEETQTKEKVEFMVENQRLQLKSTLLATKQSLSEAKENLKDLKTAYPLDLKAIIETSDEVESLEDGVKKLEALQKELGLE